MKNLLFSRRKVLFMLTDALSELLSSGLSLQSSLALLSERKSPLGFCACHLHTALSSGMTLSVAFCSAPALALPDWYASYIAVAEECERISPILSHLRSLLFHEKMLREKIFAMLSYPCFVTLLTAAAGFFSVFYLLPSLSSFFGGDFSEAQKKAFETMLFADVGLLTVFAALVFFVSKVFSPSPVLNVIKTMAFFSEHDIPTLQAVSCAFAFVGREKKIAFALLSLRNRLLDGESIADAFGFCLEKAGFKAEGRLLSEFLYICEQTGNNNGFARSARVLEEKQARRERILLSSIQPALLLLASVYITVILKIAFLPYLTSLGGIL